MSISRKSIRAISLVVILGLCTPLSTSADGLFSLDRTHKYLGLGTIGLAAATAATSGDIDIHEPLAYATAACALSTVITGYLVYGDRFDTSDAVFTQDNTHIMLGTIGAILLTTGVILAADSYDEETDSVDSHAGLAIAGGVLMTVAIIDIKW